MSAAAFWNRKAEKYAKSRIPNQAVYEKKLSITRECLESDSLVLEIGCGTGTTALHHAKYIKTIDAWDISENMLTIARAKAKENAIDNVRFRCASVESVEYPAEHYDLAMAHSVLHLVDDKEHVIRDIFSTLKPGGIFVTSTPCLANKMNWLKFIAKPLGMIGIWPDVFFFSSTQLQNSLENVGFVIEKSWLPEKAIAHFFVAKKPK